MDKVKKVCAELGITQNELAEMMGLHYTAFSKWKEKIPKNAEVCLDLILENHRLRAQMSEIKKALLTLKNLENF
ncbi:helix-turn-helix transcriptional regulator [Helicobacter mastomyrinus]|uniref:Helix-turn-helix transcriptional regulator n=1 Tax=Helicobacter mastomyrinus TaxID=287948 RepID=A0ABZ3F5B1_9HELI